MILLFLLAALPARAEWVSLGGAEDSRVEVKLLESQLDRSVIEVTVPGFVSDPVTIAGREYRQIRLPGEGMLLEPGLPELPHVCRSLLIPDRARMETRVLTAETVELSGVTVAPSKGNLPRTIDPSTVPWTFGDLYTAGGTYPGVQAREGEPYVLRDYRGLVFEALPFQAEPARGVLQVIRRMVIEVRSAGDDQVNILDRPGFPSRIAVEFADIYRHQFINWSNFTALEGGRYVPVVERGPMLIITYDAFHDAMLPLVEWKNQSGRPTRMVDVSTIGTTATQIDAYITGVYNAERIAFVLLVGDNAQIPTLHAGGGASDPSYATIVGTDNYPEIFVGRYSAETVAHVQTQVARTIAYEKTPMAGAAWYHKGTGIGSDQGPGDDGEFDYQHEDVIRTRLLGYTYTQVDQIYDPGASAAMVTAALNDGRSVVNYTGHGFETGWSTTGFSSSNVAALQNDWMLPFIVSVACVNGYFENYTCFAEAWLRSVRGGNPIGAVGTYMSSINQTWNPPMCGQDAAVDLLVNDQMHTYGGLCYNGSCQMMDEYGSGGADMFVTWHIFGDPSLMVRTDTPAAMTAQHSGVLLIGQTDYPVMVPGVPGALCALYGDGILYGSITTGPGGDGVIHMDDPPMAPTTLTLTVTAYNKTPVIEPVQVVAPTGPYLVLDRTTVLDQGGDADGALDIEETAGIEAALKNVGVDPATGIVGTLTTADPFVQVTAGQQPYPDIPAGGTRTGLSPFEVHVSPAAPDQHAVSFALTATGNEGSWDCPFSLVVSAPVLAVDGALVDDSQGGNSDGGADPGETFFVQVVVSNSGHAALHNLTGTLSSTSSDVVILDGTGECVAVPIGGTGNVAAFEVEVLPQCPDPSSLPFQLRLQDAGGYDLVLAFTLPVGAWVDDAEADHGWSLGWTGDTAVTGMWIRDDPVGTVQNGQQAQTEDDHTLDPGVKCFVTGNGVPGGPAGDSDVDGGKTTLVSPIFRLNGATSAVFSYWRWYTNNLGNNPNQDWWDVDVTGDGNAWVHLEHTTNSANSWSFYSFNLESFVPMTDQVRVRFVADDEPSGSLVEAAVDDISLNAVIPPSVDVPPAQVRSGNGIVSLGPNPLRSGGSLVFRTADPTRARIVLYNVAGRMVRRFYDGPIGAGVHTIPLDRGALASGIYFLRLETERVVEVRQIAIVR